MIFIGIGANLPSATHATPLAACVAAVAALDAAEGVRVLGVSRWFESAPVPVSDQPWFINGVAQIETDLSPAALLELLHGIEIGFGRVRGMRNAPRVLDLDLLAYDDVLISGAGSVSDSVSDMEIPHARLHQRAFVVLPLSDLAPNWVHPALGKKLKDLAAKLPKDQICRPIS